MQEVMVMQNLTGLKTLILNQGISEEIRERIRKYFNDAFTLDEKLYELLADDDAYYQQADPLRHSLISLEPKTGRNCINSSITVSFKSWRSAFAVPGTTTNHLIEKI